MQPNVQPNQEGFYTPPQPQYDGGDMRQPTHQAPGLDSVVEWDASEYIHHEKGVGWGLVVGAVALVAVGGTIWFKQWLLAVLLVVMTVVFAMYGFRRPRTLHYRLTSDSVTIAHKTFYLADYKAFGITADGPLYSIILLPIKRFAPAVTMYIAQNDGEKIVDILGDQLPMEEVEPDPIDLFMRKLRF